MTSTATPITPPAPPARATGIRAIRADESDGVPAVTVFTLVMWLGCVGVGVLGFRLGYAQPRLPAVIEAIEGIEERIRVGS